MLLRGLPNKVTKGESCLSFHHYPAVLPLLLRNGHPRPRVEKKSIHPWNALRGTGTEGGRKFPGSRLYKCGGGVEEGTGSMLTS